jgi:phage tail sheath protein FI
MALPNVKVNVDEQTLIASNTAIPFTPALIIKTKSGPIGTVESITSEAQFKAIFGDSDYTTPSAYALQVYLRSYSYAYVTRIANSSSASLGTGTLTFVDSGEETVSLISATTDYKTDLFNGKEIKLVYDGTAHKLWLDLSSLKGKTTISIKEDYTADTATAVTLSGVLTNLVNSVNSANLGITLTNLFVEKIATDTVPTVAQLTNGLSFYIAGGDSGNGTAVDTTDVLKFIDLYDTTAVDFDVMVIPEYTNADVVNYATKLALKNNFMVLTSPDVSTVQNAIQAVANYDDENRGSLAVYFPNVYYSNFVDNNGDKVAIPACMAVLTTYAKTDITYKWSAPAGVTRGKLSLVKDLTVKLSDEDLTTLYDNTIPVNGINDISGKGFIVWGNKTTTASSTFFDRINVARLVKYITKQAYLISWSYLFEPITNSVFDDWLMKMETFLNNIKVGYGLDDYSLTMDSSINTAETIANNQLNAIIKIKPTEVAEFITIDLTVTDTIEVTIES